MAGGRPLKFKDAQTLQDACDAFFDDCLANDDPFTITGLALAIGATRELLCNYEEKDEFCDTVKAAKMRCENYAEKQLFKTGGSGPIFALKNYGWRDKTETDLTSKGEAIKGTTIVVGSQADKDLLEKI